MDGEERPVLNLRVAAAAADGAANAAVIALVARSLKRPTSAVRLAAGHTARIKRLELDGVDEDDIARAFPPPPVAR